MSGSGQYVFTVTLPLLGGAAMLWLARPSFCVLVAQFPKILAVPCLRKRGRLCASRT